MRNKIIRILIMGVLSLYMIGCTNSNSQKEIDSKEKEASTSDEVLINSYNFICEDMKDNNFYLTSNYIYMNKSIYDKGSLYSNNQNCRKNDNINYDRYVILTSSAVGDIFIKDNKAYVITKLENQNAQLVEYNWTPEYKEISLESDIISISLESYIWNDRLGTYDYKFYVLKNNGNVYLYETKNHKIISKDKIIYNSEQCGKIQYFYYSSNDSKSIENIILLSENGLYTNEIIKDDNCTKYADIECKKEFRINNEYEQIKNDVIFFNKDYIVDKDYKLYDNNFVNLEHIP